jgi:osmotically-inducible protein OsmY
MTRPAALLILPAHPPTGAERDACQTTTRLVAQGLEDLHLAERVAHELRATRHGPLRRVAVTVHARLVTLEGRVPSYYLKQLAQATALAAPGVDHVRNDLDVGPIP